MQISVSLAPPSYHPISPSFHGKFRPRTDDLSRRSDPAKCPENTQSYVAPLWTESPVIPRGGGGRRGGKWSRGGRGRKSIKGRGIPAERRIGVSPDILALSNSRIHRCSVRFMMESPTSRYIIRGLYWFPSRFQAFSLFLEFNIFPTRRTWL